MQLLTGYRRDRACAPQPSQPILLRRICACSSTCADCAIFRRGGAARAARPPRCVGPHGRSCSACRARGACARPRPDRVTSPATLGGLATGQVRAQVYGTTFEPRIAGPLGDPNFFAQILVLAVPFALFLAWTARRRSATRACLRRRRRCGVATVFTYSRGGALALAASSLRRPRSFAASTCARSSLGAIPSWRCSGWLCPTTSRSVSPHSRNSCQAATRSCGRTVRSRSGGCSRPQRGGCSRTRRCWASAPATTASTFVDYAQQVGSEARLYVTPTEGYYPHNLYLEVAAETGVVGLAVFGLRSPPVSRISGEARVRLAGKRRPLLPPRLVTGMFHRAGWVSPDQPLSPRRLHPVLVAACRVCAPRSHNARGPMTRSACQQNARIALDHSSDERRRPLRGFELVMPRPNSPGLARRTADHCGAPLALSAHHGNIHPAWRSSSWSGRASPCCWCRC